MVWSVIQSIRYPILILWQPGIGLGVAWGTKLGYEMQKMVEMCI